MSTKTTLHLPGEWTAQESIWLAWPSHDELWEDNLGPTQGEFSDLCRAINLAGTKIELACLNSKRKQEAERFLAGVRARMHILPYGEIWFRDTLPLFMLNPKQEVELARFQFNGWGEKYLLPGDEQIGDLICEVSGRPVHQYNWVLEGGSVESNGAGIFLTTEQCLLNINRNRQMKKSDIEQHLKDELGAEKILWVKEGLINDHTDGHIDTIVRFIGPNEIVIMSPAGLEDPNREILMQIEDEVRSFVNLNNQPFTVHTVPSPGEVVSEFEELMPASYVNFLITNNTVIVPTYGIRQDQRALEKFKDIFPKHKVIGLSARSILTGGGAFHCITQQIPKGAPL